MIPRLVVEKINAIYYLQTDTKLMTTESLDDIIKTLRDMKTETIKAGFYVGLTRAEIAKMDGARKDAYTQKIEEERKKLMDTTNPAEYSSESFMRKQDSLQ
ncbi:hypothetical protein JW711_06625 [Candidatus Woesearchaeota archaeon]|nr:hypothetical protein [Candidatus Woesearchaeota archaeon]